MVLGGTYHGSMKELKVIDRFYINGRGPVFTGTLKDNPGVTQENLNEWRDNKEVIIIRGEQYRIYGIERQGLARDSRPEFGVLVKKQREASSHGE